MNIKRRVYDALNVLIALGLLKRISTNKILSRKTEFDFPGGRVLPERGSDSKEEDTQAVGSSCCCRSWNGSRASQIKGGFLSKKRGKFTR